MIAQLKNFVVDRLDMDELFALSAFGKSIRVEYQERSLPIPVWLEEQLGVLNREILARRRDELEKRLKDIKAQRSTLETASEKRTRLDVEQAELEKQLAGGVSV